MTAIYTLIGGWRGLLGIGVALLLSTLLIIEKVGHGNTRADLTRAEQALTAEQGAHKQTQLNYFNAAEKARKADAANKARAENEQRANVERTKADYEARIATARADAQRLRDRLAQAPANSRGAGTAPVSGRDSAGPAAPSAPQDIGLSIDERLIATEQAIQLDALIDYVNGLLKVDMNGRQ